MLLEAGVPALCGAALRLAPRFGVDAVLCRTTVRSPIYYLTLFIGIIVFILARTIISWRSRKSSGYYGSGMAGRAGKGRGARPMAGLEGLAPGVPLAPAIGAICPRCGTIAGRGAITCPSCGYDGPGFTEPAISAPAPSQAPAAVQLQPAAAGVEVVASAKCPYCGTLLAAGTTICPVCNWRLRAPAAAGTTPAASGRSGIIRRDVMAGGAVAFLKDEWVKVELESPDPQRPEYKYVCHSQSLDKNFRLSDMDLSL